MTTQYAGLCIGGPMAGQSAVSRSNVLKVQVRPPLKTMLEASLAQGGVKPEVPEDIIYNWLHTGGLGLWIVSGMNMNDAINEMATAYMEKMSERSPAPRRTAPGTEASEARDQDSR